MKCTFVTHAIDGHCFECEAEVVQVWMESAKCIHGHWAYRDDLRERNARDLTAVRQ